MQWKFGKAVMGLVLVVIVAASALPAPAQFRNGRPARPEVTLPLGTVRNVILENCTACHGINDWGYNALDRAGWDALVERMKTNTSGLVVGTAISDVDKEILLDYLVAEFGPDSEPFPREYVPRELTEGEFFSDEQAESILAATCENCHSLERVDETRGDVERWRAILISMMGKGAGLSILDVEPLVEWLARTKGTNPTN